MAALGPYVLIVACILGAMLAGLLIAGLIHQANQEEDCQEWVLDEARATWSPCPHRRPCPLHDRNGVKRHA